jgi:hypothetical protein
MREVTIHLGSASFPELWEEHEGKQSRFCRQTIGLWDLRAFNLIQEYLVGLIPGIRVQLEVHVAELPAYDVAKVFRSGNHIVIGSPRANRFSEEVVCRVWQKPPYTPSEYGSFDLGFVWGQARHFVPSSFARQTDGDDIGIEDIRTKQLVARRTLVPCGEGEDCALVVAWRSSCRPAHRVRPIDERLVLVLAGHSGPGTLAGARVATTPGGARALYPPDPFLPCVKVVKARYERQPGREGIDNRELTHWELLEEPSATQGLEDVPGPRQPAPRAARAQRPRRTATKKGDWTRTAGRQ